VARRGSSSVVSSQKTSYKKKYFLIVIFPVVLLLSCRSLSPVSLNQSGIPEREKLQFHTFEAFSPQWQPLIPEEGAGLFYTAAGISDPKLEFWAIKADLTNPKIKIVAGGQFCAGDFKSIRVSSFVRNNDLHAGINTVPFDHISSKEGKSLASIGLVISNNILLSPPVPHYDGIVFYRAENPEKCRAAILPQGEILNLDMVEHASGGFRIVLEHGILPERLCENTQPMPRHPRSAAGLSADGNTLYLLVIDGRRSGSIGATEAETGLILGKLGAASGLNLDGGGSSAMALRFRDGKVRTVNTPIHGGIKKRERAVAACIGIQYGYL